MARVASGEPPRSMARVASGEPPQAVARRYRAKARARLSCPVVRVAVRTARAPWSCALSCGLAVGRDVPIAPPRHRRGARLRPSHPRAAPPARYRGARLGK